MGDNTSTLQKAARIKALKEAGRLLLFAVPAILIQVISGNADLTATYGGTILVVLKAIDKYLHENPNINVNGIAPF